MQGKLLPFKANHLLQEEKKQKAGGKKGQGRKKTKNLRPKLTSHHFRATWRQQPHFLCFHCLSLFSLFSLRIAFTSSGFTQANANTTLLTMATETSVSMCVSTKSYINVSFCPFRATQYPKLTHLRRSILRYEV